MYTGMEGGFNVQECCSTESVPRSFSLIRGCEVYDIVHGNTNDSLNNSRRRVQACKPSCTNAEYVIRSGPEEEERFEARRAISCPWKVKILSRAIPAAGGKTLQDIEALHPPWFVL